MNAEELKKAREICEAATDGPWFMFEDWAVCTKKEDGSYNFIICSTKKGQNEFIAFARTALPAALDEIERLQKENAELKKHLGDSEETEHLKVDAEKWQVLITQAGRTGLSEDDLFKMTL